MFNLFNIYKVHLFIVLFILLLGFIGLLKYQNLKLENEKQVLQSKIAAYDIAINAANDMSVRQEHALRLREAEADKFRQDAKRRMENTLQDDVPNNCEGAINYGIEKAQTLKFIWNSNLP